MGQIECDSGDALVLDIPHTDSIGIITKVGIVTVSETLPTFLTARYTLELTRVLLFVISTIVFSSLENKWKEVTFSYFSTHV